MRQAVFLNDLGIVCALGRGRTEVAARLFAGDGEGMIRTDAFSPGRPLVVGRVQAALPEAPPALAGSSRNSRLLWAAAQELLDSLDRWRGRVGPDRIATVVGTSIAGIPEAEQAIRALRHTGSLPRGFHYRQQELGSAAHALAEALHLAGPAYTVSTACSSGAKALASAARLLRLGACDAAVAGGSDALCALTVAGFSALESISPDRCNPFSRNRNGINLGEGAALFLMTREPAEVRLLGVGESSDAHHITAPDPSGAGVLDAMREALCRAALAPEDLDYLNLHGTGTVQNDAMEARVVHELFGPETPCSSTKPLTGHTLGGAGAIEAAFCYLTLAPENRAHRLPPHLWDGIRDPALAPLGFAAAGACAPRLTHCLSSSFAFGGSNTVVVLGRG
ncbi:MAG TPA: beta-ketoacyl-ACP synthase [Candidatus Sulfotelmatobacter sp.]|nr:beta-ketoacyl-ACP synthase [Candidatus Sulfotelmatobacter sp.]